jgi:GTP pyrophosphokinase
MNNALEKIRERFGKEKAEIAEKASELAAKNTEKNILENTLEELLELKADFETIIAAVILQALKKQAITEKEAEEQFGKQALELAETARKIQKLSEKASEGQKTQALKKLLLSTSKDFRILTISFTDKLIELQETKSKKTAEEVTEIFSPLAHKLGMNRLKNQLEDNAFKILHPKEFEALTEALKEKKEEREKQVEEIKKTLKEKLEQAGIKAEVLGRAKHLHSIWKKLQNKRKRLEEIHDLMAVRVITESAKDCYQALGIVHELWRPLQTEFKDYIAKPKPNLYQSIHTVIIGPNKKPVEVQIRTNEMHYLAETGIAAHWKYKGEENAGKLEKKISWLKEAIDWLQDSEKAKEFMNSLKLDFFENEIFTFTPKGQVIELPEGATPIDFAFTVHSDLGFKCEKAKVNNKIVPLDYELQNGDSVEIMTSEKQQPKRQWLGFVKTSKAMTKIRQAVQLQAKEKKPEKTKQTAIKNIAIKSNEDKAIRLAKCCTPVPGDEITGFLTTKRKISVHRIDCNNLEKMKSLKKVNVEWSVKGKENFKVAVKILATEKPGLLSELLNTFAKFNTKVISANAKTTLNKNIECSFELETKNLKALEEIMKKAQSIKGVQKVERA